MYSFLMLPETFRQTLVKKDRQNGDRGKRSGDL